MPYPITEKIGRVLDGHAVYNEGLWWEAVVAVETPKGEKKIGIFKWHNKGTDTEPDWRRKQYVYINKKKHFKELMKGLKDMGATLNWDD